MNSELTGAERIAAERARQVSEEGWSPKHDDQHENAEMALAAVAYAAPLPVRVEAWVPQVCGCRSAGECTHSLAGKTVWMDPWPWDQKWDKRGQSGRIRDLVKAGALIAAEIDRLQRIENKRTGCRADSDGDCVWSDCPQLRDGEPKKSGRSCPLDVESGEL